MLRKTTLALMVAGLGFVPVAARAADEPARSKVESTMESAQKAVKDTADTAGTEISDSWITMKTKMALMADERVSALDVNVTTEKGMIRLRGKVESEKARLAAEEVAGKIDGAKGVKNELTVASKSARKTVDRKDDQIVKDIEKRIKDDPRLKKADIGVRSDKGIVTLSGKAPSLETSFRASEVAHKVRGVRAVRNEVEVGTKGQATSS